MYKNRQNAGIDIVQMGKLYRGDDESLEPNPSLITVLHNSASTPLPGAGIAGKAARGAKSAQKRSDPAMT